MEIIKQVPDNLILTHMGTVTHANPTKLDGLYQVIIDVQHYGTLSTFFTVYEMALYFDITSPSDAVGRECVVRIMPDHVNVLKFLGDSV